MTSKILFVSFLIYFINGVAGEPSSQDIRSITEADFNRVIDGDKPVLLGIYNQQDQEGLTKELIMRTR